ncbi:hypothetical protein MYX84_11410 [Acidobacteria bacterium AH-259-O06]|nr:hypothetical protein [Acidobacteria bacterium AH-259-O06]
MKKGRATMTEIRTTKRLRVTAVLECYGKCLELAAMDRHFHNISGDR